MRLVVAVLAIFGIVAFFVSSQNSAGSSVGRVNKEILKSNNNAGGGIQKGTLNDQSNLIQPPVIEDEEEKEQQQQQQQLPLQLPLQQKTEGKKEKGTNQQDLEKEDSKNTLQGTPHSGTKPPYEKDDKPKKNIAEKIGGNPGDSIADSNGNIKETESETESGNESENKDENVNDVEKITDPKKVNMNSECNEVKYVVMIDAGSTGSRVHVYEFNTCTQPPKLLSEEFMMLEPGLSSFDTDTVGAAKSLDPLLEKALEKVPKDKQGCTPVAVKATAGLRLLGEEKSNAILAEVRKHLEEDYPFAVVKGDGISILDGKDEGVYAWVTANYLLGNIGNKDKLPTAAVFDLGGGSTQIVFEPEYKDDVPVEGETKYKFTFGDHDFTLYQFSHLGFGLMQGRNKINKLVLDNYKKSKDAKELTLYTSKKEAKEAVAEVDIINPCIPPKSIAKNVAVEVADGEIYVVNMKGSSEATGSQCRFLAEQILNKDQACESKPCSFNGVHQPSLVRAFNKDSDMYVFSFFYDRTNPIGMPSSFTVEELRDLTKSVCQGESLWNNVFLGEHVDNLSKEPQWCLDLSFITAMLHTGYDIPLHRELRTAKKIDNNELGWCLGASLPLLDSTSSNWECKKPVKTSFENI